MLVTPCGLTREWGSRSFPGPDNILTAPPHPQPCPQGMLRTLLLFLQAAEVKLQQDLPPPSAGMLARPASSLREGLRLP